MKRALRCLGALLLPAFLMIMGVPAWAEEETLPERFLFRLGGYQIRNADFVGRLDANDLPVGTYVDFRDTLGGEERATVFRLDGIYRFNDHHALGFSWYDVKFNGSTVLGRDIIWNGVTYPFSTAVDSELKFDVYKLNYQYSLRHDTQVELGVTAGLHVMKTAASINASGIGQYESIAVTAPLPVFGLFADYKFTPRFSTYYNMELFFINYEDRFRGSLFDFLLGIEYRLFPHVGIGAAYNVFALNAKVKGDTMTLFLNGNWTGTMLYGALYF